ncbi:hypothetical protein [Streptomyces sp. NPDC050738]|uniref:hypothetical protein n=1 Tax=Streptomyces sp. NPDC050738 TaxID=3154744 RepID=UPI003433934E
MAGAGLVRVVAAQLGEGLAGILAGVAAYALIFFTVDDLRLSGFAGRLQIAGLVVMELVWAACLLLSRPRRLREFGAAVMIEDLAVLDRNVEQARHLRRGRVRVAVLVLMMALAGAYVIHMPLIGLFLPVMLALGFVDTWLTILWERRCGVLLWKPPLSAVGRENWRRSPYYASPVRAG